MIIVAEIEEKVQGRDAVSKEHGNGVQIRSPF